MPSCSIRPNATPEPPGVHASSPDSAKLAANSMTAPATMVRLPCTRPETAIRPRRKGSAIQPRQQSPNSTPSVALWVAAAKAVKANSANFSIAEILSPCSTRRNSDNTDSPAKISVSSILASQGSAVVRISTTLKPNSRIGLTMPNTRSVSCRIHSVASAWIPRLSQKPDSSPKCR